MLGPISRRQFFALLAFFILLAGLALLRAAGSSPKPWLLHELLAMYTGYATEYCTDTGGWAFDVAINITPFDLIVLSVYERPDFEFRTTFSFLEGIFKKDKALLFRHGGLQEPLAGKAEFSQAAMAIPFTGTFNLQTASGKKVLGQFRADWGDVVMNCDLMK